MPLLLSLTLITFFSVFTQSVAGFGAALVAMPLLTAGILPLEIAAPLVALIASVGRPIMIYKYRSALNLRNVWMLILASAIAIPFGVNLIAVVDERVVRTILAMIVIGYVLLNVFSDRLPTLEHPAWAYGLGFVGGLLFGAFNIGGPPAVIYGTGRRWLADEFRANIQIYALVNGTVVLITHFYEGHITADIWYLFIFNIPAMCLGLLLGFGLNTYINQEKFRKLVLGLFLIMGVRLLL
jgi:uncharacterized protein